MTRSNKKRKGSGKKVYSIIVDGETEVWYFQLLKQHESLNNIDIKPDIPKRKKLSELYQLAISNSAEFSKVIWIIDLDVVIKEDRENRKKGVKSAFQELSEYMNSIEAEYKNVRVLINTPCLEYWLLLHLKETGKFFPTCNAVCKQFRGTILSDYEKTEKYYKNRHSDIYDKIKHLQDDAIENAEKLGDFDIEDPETGQAGIYQVFYLLNLKQKK